MIFIVLHTMDLVNESQREEEIEVEHDFQQKVQTWQHLLDKFKR